MKRNSGFIFIGMACMVLSISCAKTSEKPSASTQKPTSASETKSDQATDKKETGTSGETVAADKDKNSSPDVTSGGSVPAAPAQTVSDEKPTIASDSEEIRKSAHIKISIKNLDALKEAAQAKDMVIHHQALVSEEKMKAQLPRMNEEHYCQVGMKGNLHPQDYLKLDVVDTKELDKENDIHQTLFKYINASGEISFLCTHTTENLFVGELAINLQKLVVRYDDQGQQIDGTDFKNPRTENRRLNAVKIKDIKKIQAIIFDENDKSAKDQNTLFRGKVVSTTEATRQVESGAGSMACNISSYGGTLTKDKVFIRVAKGISQETPQVVPTEMTFSVYRADANTFFILNCLVKKNSLVTDIFELAEGVFDFGALQRPEYSKKYDEMVEIHQTATSRK